MSVLRGSFPSTNIDTTFKGDRNDTEMEANSDENINPNGESVVTVGVKSPLRTHDSSMLKEHDPGLAPVPALDPKKRTVEYS